MNFFSSIFSDDPEPSESDPPSKSTQHDPAEITDTNTSLPESPNPSSQTTSPQSSNPDPWNFGSFIKTIATRSESVIGTYRRDFEEFGSGLLKETVTIRDVASRAVHEFPDSIDAGAAVAQESLESVGQAIDNLGSSVWQGTANIIAHGKDLQIFDDDEYEGSGGYVDDETGYMSEKNLNAKKYSWFDTRMAEIQCDARTYSEDPEDTEDYRKWTSGFVFDDRGEDIQRLIGEERAVERMYLELVPVTVDKESFWCRYFYKVNKLKQTEEARARIVKRAISGEDEEDLSWDVDDEDEPDTNVIPSQIASSAAASSDDKEVVENFAEKNMGEENKDSKLAESSPANNIIQAGATLGMGAASSSSLVAKVDKSSDEKADNGDSCKEDSDVSIISTQPSLLEAEELGWDEIDDVGSDHDDSNVTKTSGSSNISNLRKRMIVSEDDDDLSWDIEDDDEPIKS